MTTWHDISLDSELAAKDLLGAGRHRSAVSRAYYAVYSAVTDCLNLAEWSVSL